MSQLALMLQELQTPCLAPAATVSRKASTLATHLSCIAKPAQTVLSECVEQAGVSTPDAVEAAAAWASSPWDATTQHVPVSLCSHSHVTKQQGANAALYMSTAVYEACHAERGKTEISSVSHCH